jgi:transketolase
MRYQRDAAIDVIYERTASDDRIMFLSADFGAPALDRYREDRADQFVHLGISEQNMIDVGAGLALDGRVVFAYAMAPFVSLRCLEQHKCSTGLMDLPVVTFVAGIGLGYADSGPTHYATEDFACLRAMVNASVYSCADANSSAAVTAYLCERPSFSFIRLDRDQCDDLDDCGAADVERGYRLLREGSGVCVISTGYMSHRASQALDTLSNGSATHVDLIRAKPFPDDLAAILSGADAVVTVDEQTPSGSLGSAVLEFMADKGISKPLKRLTLPEKYFFENGGRQKLLDDAGLSVDAVAAAVRGR